MVDPIAAKPVSPVISIQPAPSSLQNNLQQMGVSPQLMLATLASGMVVRGFVINRDAQNNPILRTQFGDLVVSSGVFIKTGSEVVFRVDPGTPGHTASARILTVDHLPLEEYSALVPRNVTGDTVTSSPFTSHPAGTSSPSTPTTPLPIVQALVLKALDPSAPASPTTPALPNLPVPPALQQLPAGTVLNLAVVDVELPPVPIAVGTLPPAQGLANLLPQEAKPTPLPSPATPLAATSLAAALPPTLPTPAATPGTPLPAAAPTIGGPLAATMVASVTVPQPVLQPAATPPSAPIAPAFSAAAAAYGGPAAPLHPPLLVRPAGEVPVPVPPSAVMQAPTVPSFGGDEAPLLLAQVIGHGEDGSNILHSNFATLKLFTPQPLPTGTNLTIQAELAPAEAAITVFSGLTPPSAGWPQTNLAPLMQAMMQLVATNPALANELLQPMPAIGPRLTSGMLFFLSAVKSGDFKAFLPPRLMSKLEASMPELLGQLRTAIAELNQQWTAPPTGEWRPVTLPLLFGAEVTPARLYVKSEGEETDRDGVTGAKSIGQRFVLDVHLSQLGEIELDGFVRKRERSASLELYFRSAQPLEAEITQGIRAIFQTATETTGMQGQLIFQEGGEHFVRPQPASPTGGEENPHTILA